MADRYISGTGSLPGLQLMGSKAYAPGDPEGAAGQFSPHLLATLLAVQQLGAPRGARAYGGGSGGLGGLSGGGGGLPSRRSIYRREARRAF